MNCFFYLGEANLDFGILERQSKQDALKCIYPNTLMYEFCKRAINHYENGIQRELLGYVVGYKKGKLLIGTELIFPTQSHVKPKVSDSTRNDRGNA